MDMIVESGTPVEVQLYKRRWFYLLVISMLYLMNLFSTLTVSQINNVFVDYFHVSYAIVDWGTIGNFPGLFVAMIVVAWLTHNKYMEFRYLAIAETAILAVSFASRMAAFASSSLFALVIFGQFLNGVCGALAFPLCLSLAMAWFPHEEVGTAIGVFMFGGAVGLVLGTLIPSHLVIQPSTNLTTNNETWKVFDRNACLIMWSVPLFISLTALVIITCFAADHPPTPPTLVQGREQNNKKVNLTFSDFLVTCKKLLLNKNYMIAATSGAILYQINVCEYAMMTQLVTRILKNTRSNLNPDVISSYSAALLASGGLFGAIVGGKLVGRFKNYKNPLAGASLLAVTCSSGIIFSYHFNSYIALFVMNPIFGFSTMVFIVALLEILTQITYPMNAAFVGTVFNGMAALAAVIMTELARLTFNSAGGFWMLVFQTGCCVIGLLVACAIKSENKRLDAERDLSEARQQEIVTESTRLLEET